MANNENKVLHFLGVFDAMQKLYQTSTDKQYCLSSLTSDVPSDKTLKIKVC